MIGYIVILAIGTFFTIKTGSFWVVIGGLVVLFFYHGFRSLYRKYHEEE